MATTFKKQMKKVGRYAWELFKASFATSLMWACAGSILLMLTMKGENVGWTDNSVLWTTVCILGGVAYNVLMAWSVGGSHYEMLVSGNVKRMSAAEFDGGYKISTHKEAKEYRVWKGVVIGGFSAIAPLLFGLILGANQVVLNNKEMTGGLALLLLIAFVTSGYSVVPLYLMNASGISVSYYLSCLFALMPLAVTGGFYIVGAYAKRNKRMRELEVKRKAEEEKATKVKKINYGALPGTKPKKRKK